MQYSAKLASKNRISITLEPKSKKAMQMQHTLIYPIANLAIWSALYDKAANLVRITKGCQLWQSEDIAEQRDEKKLRFSQIFLHLSPYNPV